MSPVTSTFSRVQHLLQAEPGISLPLVLQNSVGLSNNLSRLLAACNSVSYLAFSFIGLLLIERAGRRHLMMWGAAGQCVCYILIAALLSQASNTDKDATFGAAATAFFFLYYVFFGICWQVSFCFSHLPCRWLFTQL